MRGESQRVLDSEKGSGGGGGGTLRDIVIILCNDNARAS